MTERHQSPSFGHPPLPTAGFAPAEPEPALDEPRTFLTFCLGGQYFALSVAPVREILDEQPVATMPGAASDVVGLIDVRGESIMIMDVSHRLGVVSAFERNRRIVVLEPAGANGRPVGVLADQVLSVVEISPSGIEAPPTDTLGSQKPGLLCGVVRLNGQLVLLLDHQLLLGTQTDDLFVFNT